MTGVRLQLEPLDDRLAPAATAVGAAPGADPVVTGYDADGRVLFQVRPFGADFRGGVRVAVGDVTGDGRADVVAAAGPGGTPAVHVLDGADGRTVSRTSAFEDTFTGGVYVALGDLNRDGYSDLVLTPDEGGGPRVRVLNGRDLQPLADFLGVDDPNFRGGARAGVGDVNGDGTQDVVVAAGFGGGPRVAGFTGQSVLARRPAQAFADFFAFEEALRNGAYLAVKDVDADGRSDLVFGGGPGGAPRVLALSARDLLAGGPAAAIRAPLANFFAGNTADRTGVRVGATYRDDGTPVVLTAGPGGAVSAFTLDGQPTTAPGGGTTGGFVAAEHDGGGARIDGGVAGGAGNAGSSGGGQFRPPATGLYTVDGILGDNFRSNPRSFNNNLQRVLGLRLQIGANRQFGLEIPNTIGSPFFGTATRLADGTLAFSGGVNVGFITSSNSFGFYAEVAEVNGRVLLYIRAASGTTAAAVVNGAGFGMSSGNWYEAVVAMR